MKKFILMLTAVVAIAVNTTIAQTTFKEVTNDLLVVNATPVSTTFDMPQHFPTTQDVKINISDGGTSSQTAVSVQLRGSKFGDTWVNIGSPVVWKLSTNDTIIVISNATENRYRKYNILYTGTGTGTSTVTNQIVKLYLE